MQIETKSASLETLAVTIQALHVSGKQMTLAVFRQLPMARAYNEDGTLRSLQYWGLVRYSIKDEGSLWAVAEKDAHLYRCEIVRHELEWLERGIDRLKQRAANRVGIRNEQDALKIQEEIETDSKRLEYYKRVNMTSETLARLPQLFIAV